MEFGAARLVTQIQHQVQPHCETKCNQLSKLSDQAQNGVVEASQNINPEHPWADMLPCAAIVCPKFGRIICRGAVIRGQVSRDGGKPLWSLSTPEKIIELAEKSSIAHE